MKRNIRKSRGIKYFWAEIIDPGSYAQMNDFIDALVELRKIKG